MKTFISRSLNRTYPACFRNSLSLMIVFLAFNASAQSVNFKIKWDQPPDPLTPTNIFYGWNDESVCEWVVVADDWACTNADPVTKIRWWGSFIGWKQQQSPILPLEWKVQIWTDVPAGVDERFSHPGKAIWEVRRPGTALIPECVGQDYDPRDPPQPGDPNIANPWETCYRWELPLGPSEFFFQNPLNGTNIYWISISARYDTNVQGPIDYPFGLKTLPRDTNSLAPDDAVRMFGPSLNNPTNGTTWVVGEGEPIYYPTTNDSWDIAFELCTSNTVTTINSKWEQPPDLTTDGIDVHASYDPHPAGCPPILLADDFQCLQTGFLTNIVVWGSWYGDFLPTNPQGQIDPAHVEFTLSIHEDIPAGANTHSRPGPVVWLATFPPGSFIHAVEAANIREGWMDPLGCPTNYVFPADTVCHRYEFNMPSAVVPEPFLQAGTAADPKVYWLDVQARIVNPEQFPRPMFGWKTSTDHWNDDATWASGTDGFPGPSPDAWGELIYPPTHPKEGASIDLAFRINTQATTSTGEETLKWSQPPYVADMLTNVYNGWNEPSLYNSPQIVADDWACTNSDKVSDVHWWGSYIGWCETNAPPVVPDGFLLSIWTDVPADPPNAPFSHPGTVLWTCMVSNYNMAFAGWDFDPRQQPCIIPESKFKFDQFLDPDCWFDQGEFTPPGTTNVFWLSIAAIYPTGVEVEHPFGWETRPHDPTSFPPDDAVILDNPGQIIPGATWAGGFPIEYPAGTSWDMSFQLTSPDEPQPRVDWGDAPDTIGAVGYPTLAASLGANHTLAAGVFLGAGVDPDGDGQPNGSATGDDINLAYPGIPFPPGDEDGVVITGSLFPGFNKGATVTASVDGWLDAWVDFNADSAWSAAESVYSGPVAAGANAIVFAVPAAATPGATFSRWRYNVAGVVLPPGGAGPDGEVEDHRVFINQPPPHEEGRDFGDAMDPPYPTVAAMAGASHVAYTNFVLGRFIDTEPNGQPTPAFDGDDINAFFPGIPFPPGDEEGVTFTSLPRGTVSAVTVEFTSTLGPGRLDAWIDFNDDGVWSAGPPEQIASGTLLAPGFNPIPITVPATAVLGDAEARFRLSSVGGLPPTGAASNGEVEDYLLTICQPDLPAFTNLMFTNIVVTNITGGQVVTLQWNVESNAVYQVQCTTTFSNSPPVNWINFGPLISAPANTLVFTNTHVLERYYRICVPNTCP